MFVDTNYRNNLNTFLIEMNIQKFKFVHTIVHICYKKIHVFISKYKLFYNYLIIIIDVIIIDINTMHIILYSSVMI